MQITPLRKIRLEKQLTIAEVAAAINYDVGNLSRLERGAQTASLEIAEKLVKFYEKKSLKCRFCIRRGICSYLGSLTIAELLAATESLIK